MVNSPATNDSSEDATSSVSPAVPMSSRADILIVEQHGGQLTCNSVPGEGTTMALILPVLSSAASKEKVRG